jgi:hypothetical protein
MTVNQQKLMGRTTTVQATNVAPQQQLVASPADTALLKDISKSLTNIIKLLSNQIVQTRKDADQTRRNQERTRRQGIELGLERSFATVKNVASAVVAPVKSILDQIIQFFVTIFLGRALILLLNWFADEKNRGKIRSIMRFLSDWWPSLVAGYILFGTGFGRIVRKVAGIAVGVTARLVVVAARLTKAILTGQILKRKGIASVFAGGGKLGGVKGFLLKGAIAAGATVATGIAVDKMMGGGNAPQVDVPEAPAVPALGVYTGGFASIKDLFSSATSGIGSKINPFTSFFGSGGLASLMQGMSGVVSGQKGIDKVPAMLTDGEFVMSRGAVQKFGVNTLEAMNAAGGGTNQPKIIRGIPHAFGGGFVGDDDLRRMAAKESVPTGGISGSREYVYNPNNSHHISNYEKLKKLAMKKGVYKMPTASTTSPPPPSPPSSGSPNVKVNVNAGSSLTRTPSPNLSTNVRPPMQSIRTNMNVPGGIAGIKSLGVQMLANYLMEKGFEKIDAMMIAERIDSAKKLTDSEKDKKIKNLRNLIQKEESWQKGFGGLFDKVVGLGKVSSSEKLSSSAKAILEGMGVGDVKGGKNVGGYRLKQQSFKDMPKTQIMTDNKGRPFVGYKAMRGGKPVYVRGPKAGTGTTNPFEMLGRMINPGAYKDNDAKLDMQKQKVAMVNSLESLQARGASVETQKKMMKQMGGNLKDTQNDLAYRKKRARLAKTAPKKRPITPTPKPAPKVVTKPRVAGGGMGGKRGSGSIPSVPKFSASSGSNRKVKNTLGIK